ncbi:hypothetical protein CF326_g6506 [Tilletia indica]|nr:hypothetical protein CF326_g6506 [Tilletia indica]
MDQKASSKVSQLTGTTGKTGCRFCYIKANYPTDKHKIGYFPLKTVSQNAIVRNRSRPEQYDLPLPLRDDQSYAQALDDLTSSINTKQRLQVQKETGVCGLPLMAYSPAFSHPNFFPPDAFHLFGSNIPSLLWETLTEHQPGDPFSFTDEQAKDFGAFVDSNGKNLPSAFCSAAPRNPYEHAGPHYKMHEWSSMTYLLLLPYLFEIVDAPLDVVIMIGDLVSAVQIAMSDNGTKLIGLMEMHERFVDFVKKWERLYVRGDANLLYRATISTHYLLHISDAAHWLGSIRIASQARCEREIGLIKGSLRSYKAPFVNLANSAVQREHLRLIESIVSSTSSSPAPASTHKLSVQLNRTHHALTEWELDQQDFILQLMERDAFIPTPRPTLHYRGKLHLPNGINVRARRAENDEARKSSRVRGHIQWSDQEAPTDYIAEVIHFLFLDRDFPGVSRSWALVRILVNSESAYGIMRGKWSPSLKMVAVDTIIEPVGAIEMGDFVYVLHKLNWVANE